MDRRVGPIVAITVVTALAACGGSDTATSPTIETAPASSTSPSTSVPATAPSIAPTSTAPSTTAPITSPATTEAPATTIPLTTSPTTSPSTAAPLPDTFFVAEDEHLVERSTTDDGVVRVVAEYFNGDGVYRSFIRLSPDRSSIYYSESYEDAWYGCESSVGVVGRIDVETGEIETVARGSRIELSADGATTVHLDSDVCVPDPSSPGQWVFTPHDRVVVTDLASGSTTVYPTDVPPDSYEAASAVDWAGIAEDGSIVVLTADDVLRRIPAGATGVIQDHPVVVDGLTAFPLEIFGSVIYAIVAGDEGSADLLAIDLRNGTSVPLASAEAAMTAGVGPEGQLIVAAFAPVSVEPGVDLTVVRPPNEQTYYYDVDW